MNIKCSRFFWRSFCLEFFGQVWGDLGKILSHPQMFDCSYTHLADNNLKSDDRGFR